LPLLAVPYYLVYGCDLRLAGYAWPDLLRVYALNILLIPANLAGTMQSLRQAYRGRTIPFQRTPKVAGRTRMPALYIVTVLAFCAYAVLGALVDGLDGRLLRAAYGLLNGAAAAYGIVTFMGLAACRADLRAWIEARGWRLPRLGRLLPSRRLGAPRSVTRLLHAEAEP
jgi:cellulose synthase (UDP-forming)